MKILLSHFKVTPKSAAAAVTATVGMLIAFHILPKSQAEAAGAFVMAILAMLQPSRRGRRPRS